ncbi:MAG: (Fe-S)-binding protein [Anaerolineae bacterium]
MEEYAKPQFTKEDVEKALGVLDEKRSRQLEAYLHACAHCGWCNDACHYYVASQNPEQVPTYKADQLRKVWKRKYDWLGKLLPWWVGAKDLDEEQLARMAEIAFRDCTFCGRCTVNCPFGVDTRLIIRTIRAMITATGKAPEILEQLANAAVAREENLEFFKEFYLEQIKELEKELQEKTGDPKASIPVEVEGAEFLYVPLSGAHTILPAAQIFHEAGQSWTLSMFEASNYGVFLHDIPRAKRIVERVINEAKRLKVKEVIITECGHAYTTFRWTAPNWFPEPWPFKVRSLVEVIDEYIREGRIAVNPSGNDMAVTYHDSCNLGRNGGVLEEPRRILQACVTDFREMTPNRRQSYCCGGGGGLVALPEYQEQRLLAGKPKADQIRATGAECVVASCDNCRHQLGELNEHYNLNVKVVGVAELVANALMPQRQKAVPAERQTKAAAGQPPD